MSILSTLNKLTGKNDKNVLAALNSLTGKTADDIEEAMGNLGSGGNGKRMVQIYLIWNEELNKTDIEFTQNQIDTILGRNIRSIWFNEEGGDCMWQAEKVEPGVFRAEAPVGVNVALIYSDQSSFDSDLKNIDINVGESFAKPFIGPSHSMFDTVPISTDPGSPEEFIPSENVFIVPDRQQVILHIGAHVVIWGEER